jgi:hypothetical protein
MHAQSCMRVYARFSLQCNALCSYLAVLDAHLPMLQCYVKYLRALAEARVGEV